MCLIQAYNYSIYFIQQLYNKTLGMNNEWTKKGNHNYDIWYSLICLAQCKIIPQIALVTKVEASLLCDLNAYSQTLIFFYVHRFALLEGEKEKMLKLR